MQRNISRVVRFGAGLIGLVILGWMLTGQAAQPVSEGLPTDWTHRHVIFSQPATAEEAWRLASDPRYWQQWHRQHAVRALSADTEFSADSSLWNNRLTRRRVPSEIHPDWSQALGVGGTVGAGNFPAKYSFSVNTANCANATTPDFVVFATGLVGSATQASIVAFDNLYSGCASPPNVPNVYWAYNTGGQILTSPVFSRDGSQLAFVQTSAGAASLVLLRWAASTTETVALPGAPKSLLPSEYVGCTAPCMTTIALTSGTGAATNDTTSSVYYDYIGDIAWVGDSGGWLHQFSPVFNGPNPPAEIRNTTWPVQVNKPTPTALTSPVHDTASGNVFVEDKSFLYGVSAATGAVIASGQVDHGVGLVSGPILDRTAEKVYVFSSNDGSLACPGPAACSGVYQFSAPFTAGTTGTEITVGTSSAAPNPLYDGDFDNAFYSSPTRTGSLYVCGDTGVNPILYRVPITAGTLSNGISVAPLTAAGNHRTCSPVTDVLNPNANGAGDAEERVFFSVVTNGRPTACVNAGCAQSFVTMPWQAGTAYQVGQEILVYRAANNTQYINVVIQAGTSGGAAPNPWPAAIGTVTVDGNVHWMNQGATQVTALAGWVLDHAYALHTRIIDSNGNVEVVTTAGTSGAAEPTNWATTAGGTTVDGTPPSPPAVTWTNAGALPSAALPAAGGTSGIIIDNTVAPGTPAGTSELYFSTLGNQNCPTAPASGCAVQASQAALK
jgi:hypothetical protein